MARRREKRQITNLVLAALVVLTLAVSLIGTMLVQTAARAPQDTPVGTADVKVRVEQSPARPSGHVTVFVLPKTG